jgi:hypothetical protein
MEVRMDAHGVIVRNYFRTYRIKNRSGHAPVAGAKEGSHSLQTPSDCLRPASHICGGEQLSARLPRPLVRAWGQGGVSVAMRKSPCVAMCRSPLVAS